MKMTPSIFLGMKRDDTKCFVFIWATKFKLTILKQAKVRALSSSDIEGAEMV